MITKLFIPKLGMTMEKATIAEWRYRHGDRVEKDAPVLVIDTEKVANEIEAPSAGKLVIVAAAGEELPCGAVVGYIAETDEEFAQAEKGVAPGAQPADAAPIVSNTGGAPAQPVAVREEAPEGAAKERLKISPLARRMAKDQGIDPRGITGSGSCGRIVRKDIEQAVQYGNESVRPAEVIPSASQPLSEVAGHESGKRIKQIVPLKGIRKAISDHMHHSHSISAPVTVMSEMDMTEMNRFRSKLLEKGEAAGWRVSYTDIFIMIVAKALKSSPVMNSSLISNEIVIWEDINIGFAASIVMEDGQNALVVPVIRNADRLSLREISSLRKELMDKARKGKLDINEMTGGTFTITNTGTLTPAWHVQTPIINQPESAILGTSSVVDRPVVINGEIVVRPIMPISLTFDHRVMDGAPPGVFLSNVSEMIADPEMIMI